MKRYTHQKPPKKFVQQTIIKRRSLYDQHTKFIRFFPSFTQ